MFGAERNARNKKETHETEFGNVTLIFWKTWCANHWKVHVTFVFWKIECANHWKVHCKDNPEVSRHQQLWQELQQQKVSTQSDTAAALFHNQWKPGFSKSQRKFQRSSHTCHVTFANGHQQESKGQGPSPRWCQSVIKETVSPIIKETFMWRWNILCFPVTSGEVCKKIQEGKEGKYI